MASQPGKQTMVMQILPNISRIKGNQTIKFRHIIEYNVRIFLFKSYTENEVGRLASRALFVF